MGIHMASALPRMFRSRRFPIRGRDRDMIFEVMDAIHGAEAEAPVSIGDVIIADCAGTGVAVVATKDVARVPGTGQR